MFCFYMCLPDRPCQFLLNLKGGVFERRQLDKFVFLKMQRDFLHLLSIWVKEVLEEVGDWLVGDVAADDNVAPEQIFV